MPPERMTDETRQRWQEKQKREATRFLRGPVPVHWIKQAAALPGKALAVGIAIWFLCGLRKRSKLKFSRATWEQFGLSRSATYRGLEHLESTSLISIDRRRGRCPIVTINEVRRRQRKAKEG
ncbi:MAG: hypothetical protein WEB58_11395 [Planctomycetaceae bacterium]